MKYINQNFLEKTFISIIAAFVLYSVLALYADIPDLVTALSSFDPLVGVLVMSLTFLSILIRFLRWDYYLRKLEIDLSWKESLKIFIIGFSMVLSPGKIGEGIKSYIMKKEYNVRYSKSLSVVLAERITDLVALTIIGFATYSVIFLPVFYSILGVTAITGIFLFSLRHLESVINLIKYLKIPYLAPYIEKFAEIYQNFQIIYKPSNQILPLIYSSLSWMVVAYSLYLILQRVSELSLAEAFFAFSVSNLAGALSFVPGGLGVVEGGMSGILHYLGLEKSLAVASTLVLRTFSFWFSFLLGLIVLGYYLYNSKKR